jgi:hypothetical protein
MQESKKHASLREKARHAARACGCMIPPLVALTLDAHYSFHPLDSPVFTVGTFLELMPCTTATLIVYFLLVAGGFLFCFITEPSLVEECAEIVIRLNGEERRAWLKKIEEDLGPEFLEKVIAAL